jgi:hypothetical protein
MKMNGSSPNKKLDRGKIFGFAAASAAFLVPFFGQLPAGCAERGRVAWGIERSDHAIAVRVQFPAVRAFLRWS